jgi:hypothetical protein
MKTFHQMTCCQTHFQGRAQQFLDRGPVPPPSPPLPGFPFPLWRALGFPNPFPPHPNPSPKFPSSRIPCLLSPYSERTEPKKFCGITDARS